MTQFMLPLHLVCAKTCAQWIISGISGKLLETRAVRKTRAPSGECQRANHQTSGRVLGGLLKLYKTNVP